MTKIDPIIAVKDVNASAQWYESVFGCTRSHGGNDFAVLKDENGEILICLHAWGTHEHPTMKNSDISPGNGLIIYYKTDSMNVIRKNLKKIGYPVEEDVHVNTNTTKREFSVRDPDGYYFTITEFHNYEG